MQIALVLALLFAVGIALFAVQNSTLVKVEFLSFRTEMAVSVLVLLSATLGAALTILVGFWHEIRRTIALRSLRQALQAKDRRIQELEQQVEQAGVVRKGDVPDTLPAVTHPNPQDNPTGSAPQ